mmetsp:Transcript_34326/g.53546  ORF Transcript_34326/g.53546 Transcript_34326/m.53546 type:complete len:228 (+) Transcript_34326:491-1174(+)
MKKGSWMFGGVGFSPFSLIFVLLLSLSVFGILEVPVWVLIGMYLLCRLAGGGYEFMKDQEGYEPGVGSKPGYGFSMVQGRRPYMEDFLNCSLKFGQGGNSSFFVVLDGHSGKRAAQWGKENLPRNLESALQNQTPESTDLPSSRCTAVIADMGVLDCPYQVVGPCRCPSGSLFENGCGFSPSSSQGRAGRRQHGHIRTVDGKRTVRGKRWGQSHDSMPWGNGYCNER